MNVQMVSRPLSGTQWSIAAEGHEAVVVEVGGGLRSYRVAGVDRVDGYAEDEAAVASAGQVLAPWPNRIRDGRYSFGGTERQLALTEPVRHNAIHGLVNWTPWHLVERTDDAVTVECHLYPQPGYAWPLLLRTRWSVGAAGLRADHEVVNLGAEPAPFGLSVHPYLRLPGVAVDDLTLRVPARTRALTDSRMLPVGAVKVAGSEYDFTEPRRIAAAVLDTTFGDVQRDADGTSAVTLSAPDGTSVSLWADAAFRWWQVFTGDALSGARRRRSVAVEPMTCAPDAFRSGRDLIVLEPGQPWRASWGIHA
ncbi:MAG TPA: aldose 1-epimerase family protein [Catenuloplanes sp.]|jgi:aldose 1-epimerase